MSIELKTFVIADYAVVERKPTLVGLFDTVFLASAMPIAEALPPLPTHYLYAHCTCASMDGSEHKATFRLLDGDAREVHRVESPCFFTGLPGQASGLNAYLTLCVQAFRLPDYGDYAWELSIDDRRVGTTGLSIVPRELGLTIRETDV